MDNSDVLNNPETQVPKSDPVPRDVDPDETPTVIEQDTGTIYSNAKAPASSPVVGENPHADTIAQNTLNNPESKETYNYNSLEQKDYDTTVKTRTVQSTGAEMAGVWESEMKMDNAYKAREGEDYKWNKLATEMAELDYAQESNQARYESMQAKQEIDKAATQAFNNYFAAEYSARQTQDKMGWTGGQQTASDLQVAFLQAESAANMYSQDEMQRYGVETKLGVARLYAEANQKALALQYYQDAVDQSIKEAEQTGWYVPAEATEMFAQDKVAREILADPNATAEEKGRAERVLLNTQAYYDAKGFSRGYAYDEDGNVVTEYYGIKCLQTLQYEETVRNNKVNEDLQRQANELQRQANNIAAEGNDIGRLQLQATYAIQDRIESDKVAERVANGTDQAYTIKGSNNYYLDLDNHPVDIPKGATVYRDGANLAIAMRTSTGETRYRTVYNSNETTANKFASENEGFTNNYRPK